MAGGSGRVPAEAPAQVRAIVRFTTIKRNASLVGIYEHPTRKAEDKSVAQLHAEVAAGTLADAGLTKEDVDGYFCAGDVPGLSIGNSNHLFFTRG